LRQIEEKKILYFLYGERVEHIQDRSGVWGKGKKCCRMGVSLIL